MFSITYIGVIITLLSYLSQVLELNIVPGEIETTVNTILAFVGGLIAFYGRFRRGDIKWFGGRIKSSEEKGE